MPSRVDGSTAAGDDDAVHPAVHQVAQVVLFPDRVAAGVAQDGDLAGPERVLGTEQYGALKRPMPSVVISPTVQLRPVCRLCACWLGRNPSASTASRAPAAGLESLLAAPFSAFDAVPTLTPARAATSASFAGPAEREPGATVTRNPFWTATARPSSQPPGVSASHGQQKKSLAALFIHYPAALYFGRKNGCSNEFREPLAS